MYHSSIYMTFNTTTNHNLVKQVYIILHKITFNLQPYHKPFHNKILWWLGSVWLLVNLVSTWDTPAWLLSLFVFSLRARVVGILEQLNYVNKVMSTVSLKVLKVSVYHTVGFTYYMSGVWPIKLQRDIKVESQTISLLNSFSCNALRVCIFNDLF